MGYYLRYISLLVRELAAVEGNPNISDLSNFVRKNMAQSLDSIETRPNIIFLAIQRESCFARKQYLFGKIRNILALIHSLKFPKIQSFYNFFLNKLMHQSYLVQIVPSFPWNSAFSTSKFSNSFTVMWWYSGA